MLIRLVLFCVSLLVLAGCSKPVPPTLTPKSATVKSVTAEGIQVALTIDVDNPNDIPLSAQSVKAKVTLADKVELGEVEVDTKVSVAAKSHKEIVAPLEVKWSDVSSIAMLAAANDTIPFTVDGTAAVGVKDAHIDVHFDVPFKAHGSVTREQLVEITNKALPKLPVLQLPQMK